MKLYTVNQIAELLKTNPETVRRWIRDGKLKASKESKKTGNIVTENALQDFLRKYPKYAGVAGATIAGACLLSGLFPPIASGMFAIGMGAKIINDCLEITNGKSPTDKYDEKNVRNLINKKIESNDNAINKKLETIEQLKKEIEELKQKNESLNMVLKNLSKEDLK